MEDTYSLNLTPREFILLYMLLKEKPCPDALLRDRLAARMEKSLYESLTIDDMENIEAFYNTL